MSFTRLEVIEEPPILFGCDTINITSLNSTEEDDVRCMVKVMAGAPGSRFHGNPLYGDQIVEYVHRVLAMGRTSVIMRFAYGVSSIVDNFRADVDPVLWEKAGRPTKVVHVVGDPSERNCEWEMVDAIRRRQHLSKCSRNDLRTYPVTEEEWVIIQLSGYASMCVNNLEPIKDPEWLVDLKSLFTQVNHVKRYV